MRHPQTLPDLTVVVALTAGGPYAVGDVCSLAFVDPTVGRLVPHLGYERPMPPPDTTFVPESITARVLRAAGPYRVGTLLTISFVDPTMARLHAQSPTDVLASHVTDDAPHVASRVSIAFDVSSAPRGDDFILDRIDHADTADGRSAAHEAVRDDLVAGIVSVAQDVFDAADASLAIDASAAADVGEPLAGLDGAPPPVWDGGVVEPTHAIAPSPMASVRAASSGARIASYDRAMRAPLVEVHLQWTPDRVRRFVTVVDKLFTIERLGWYRHVLAMRLLVPDRISCGDGPSDLEAMRYLHALRAACVETLGRPMLGAFMPNFAVTTDWLESIDSPAIARALAGVRSAIEPFVTDNDGDAVSSTSDNWTVGRIDRDDFYRSPAANVEALMPVLVASHATSAELTERLYSYRRALIDVFGQTAQSADAVRLGAMTQPNHALDDRLWQLVGTVGETFGGPVAVA